MATDVDIQIAADRLKESLSGIIQRFRQRGAVKLGEFGRYAVSRFRAERLSSGGADSFRVRSGDLRRSIGAVVRGEGEDARVHIYSTSPYARIHETGGEIRPKRAKMLALPIEGSPAMTPAGRARYPSGGGNSLRTTLPRDHHFWVHESASGKLYLMGRPKGGTGEAEAWYRLRHSVTIKPRLRFVDSIRSYTTQLRTELARAAQEAIDG